MGVYPSVLFIEPPRTRYDLNFSLFGIPVRVHPFFWLVALLLGGNNDVGEVIRWVAIVFVSILVHEMGHATVARYFGARPWITLYSFGGLASYRGARGDTQSQILITLAGPAAGFLFAAAIAAVLYALQRKVEFLGVTIGQGERPANWQVYVTVWQLLYVNIFWGLVNLLPVYPLDGGQVSMELFRAYNPWEGTSQALWLSVIVAVAVAAASFVYLQEYFLALFFGYMAYTCFTMLQGGFGRRW